MVTRIHAFGPNGELSPGAAAALAGLGGGGGGDTTVQIGTVTLPESPTEGLSVSVLADSDTVLPEDVTWDSGGEPTITERMLLVFVWSGTDWVGTYGPPIPAAPVAPDTTGPTAGTLGVVPGVTTADLTVTGASDDTALHATPYAFSTNNGSTWSAYQAEATYEATGLTADTSYTFRHRVRDAAGNVTVGTAVVDSTEPVPSDTTPPTAGTLAASAITSDSFTLTVTGASDDEALHGTPYRFSTDNGATYSAWQTSAVFNATGLDAETEYDCVHQVRDAALNVATGSSIPVTTEAASGGGSGLIEFLDKSTFTTSGTTHTHSDVPFGTESPDRHIVIAVSGRAGAVGRSITAITIGGVSASLVSAPFDNLNVTTFAVANVPTGTSGDVVVTFSSGGSTRSAIGAWRAGMAVNIGTPAVQHNATSGSVGPLTITADGAGVAMAVEANTVPNSYLMPTFTGGVSLDDSVSFASYYSVAFGSTDVAGATTVTATGAGGLTLLFATVEPAA